MAIVTYTHEEAMALAASKPKRLPREQTPEQIERLADEDELDEGYGIAADYDVLADGSLTEKATGRTFTRAALLDELTAQRFAATLRDAAE